jgi:hypothetical protein
MKISVYNPQKGRLETVDVEFTNDNTTWFDNCEKATDIYMITDFDGGLLIKECDYTYTLWIYDISRVDIGYDQIKARQLMHRHE